VSLTNTDSFDASIAPISAGLHNPVKAAAALGPVVFKAASNSVDEQVSRGAGQNLLPGPVGFGTFASGTAQPQGTVQLLTCSSDNSGDVFLSLAITGASASPAQNSFTAISYTGAFGPRLETSAAASFTANASAVPQETDETFPANTSLWQWLLNSAFDFDFTIGQTYSVTLT
jgi:hypothetical protein